MDLNTGAILREVPGSNLIDEEGTTGVRVWFLSLSHPEKGAYIVKVKGIKPGTTSLEIHTYDTGSGKTSAVFPLEVTGGGEAEYLIEYSADPLKPTRISRRR